ncbi:MAG: rhamnogalacturonan acetylesterase [Chitinophagaceae bacterium]
MFVPVSVNNGSKSLQWLLLIATLLTVATSFAQLQGNAGSGYDRSAAYYTFDFGEGKAPAGYIKVTPVTLYTDSIGYGFSSHFQVHAVDRKTGHLPAGDFITAGQPFFFSVKLPEGNYDIKLVLGDANGSSATTVRVENRRLMLPPVRTTKGQLVTKSFTVHVRDSLLRNEAGLVTGTVRLKPREVNYPHWDNRLTLEFNDSLPKVCAMEIYSNKTATTVFLAGNSTVVDQDREPWAAWGQLFPAFFEPGRVAIANYAESGETLLAFRNEKRLDKIWSLAKPGDYLFIEFAHNDQKPGPNHLEAFTTYTQTLKEWIAEARKRNVTPVLITSMHRRSFDSAGHIVNTLGDYPEAMLQLARDEKLALIDLHTMSETLYEDWGPAASIRAFVHYPAGSFPGQTTALADNTHFSVFGAYELARCVVEGIKRSGLPLGRYLKKDIPAFDPGRPDDHAAWYWPLSPLLQTIKPDGN